MAKNWQIIKLLRNDREIHKPKSLDVPPKEYMCQCRNCGRVERLGESVLTTYKCFCGSIGKWDPSEICYLKCNHCNRIDKNMTIELAESYISQSVSCYKCNNVDWRIIKQ